MMPLPAGLLLSSLQLASGEWEHLSICELLALTERFLGYASDQIFDDDWQAGVVNLTVPNIALKQAVQRDALDNWRSAKKIRTANELVGKLLTTPSVRNHRNFEALQDTLAPVHAEQRMRCDQVSKHTSERIAI